MEISALLHPRGRYRLELIIVEYTGLLALQYPQVHLDTPKGPYP